MEDPATWGKAEHVVSEALELAWEARMSGFVGLSAARQITDALRQAGLLVDDTSVTIERPVLAEPPPFTVCDCCGQRRTTLPFHHDAHDDSGRSWDYCQECNDAGCTLVECSL